MVLSGLLSLFGPHLINFMFLGQVGGSDIGSGNGTAGTATAIPMFDKWRLSRTKVSQQCITLTSISTYIVTSLVSSLQLPPSNAKSS